MFHYLFIQIIDKVHSIYPIDELIIEAYAIEILWFIYKQQEILISPLK